MEKTLEENRLGYIYICPDCGKCSEHEQYNNNDSSIRCTCAGHTPLRLSQPKETIAFYKKRRILMSMLTLLFAIVIPLVVVALILYKPGSGAEVRKATSTFKLNFLTILLSGLVVLKNKHLLIKWAEDTSNLMVRVFLILINKCLIWILAMALVGLIWKAVRAVTNTWASIFTDLQSCFLAIVVFQALAYGFFDVLHSKYNYIIKRALKQMETIQALDIRDSR